MTDKMCGVDYNPDDLRIVLRNDWDDIDTSTCSSFVITNETMRIQTFNRSKQPYTSCFVNGELINTFNISYPFDIFIKGILEMTQGLNSLINLNIKFKEIIAIFFITFGGFSIHTQVKCILDEQGLNYKYFLKANMIRLLH